MASRDIKQTEDGLRIPTSNFKMPKSAKRMIASIGDKDKRDAWRRAMIQAVLQGQEVPEPKKKGKGSADKE